MGYQFPFGNREINRNKSSLWGCHSVDVEVFVECQIWTDERSRGTTKDLMFWLSIGNRFSNLLIPESWESSHLIILEGLTTQ